MTFCYNIDSMDIALGQPKTVQKLTLVRIGKSKKKQFAMK